MKRPCIHHLTDAQIIIINPDSYRDIGSFIEMSLRILSNTLKIITGMR